MPDLIIKPTATSGNKLILKAQDDTAILTTSDSGATISGDLVPATPMSHRNMIINGGMQVWQRSTSAVASGTDYHTVDRFKFALNGAMAYTSERHAMTLAELNTTGHGYAIKCLCTTADTSVAATDYAYIQQDIEAQNLQHLQYGTASAKTITLSFWVKSNKTGTYTISIRKHDATSYCIPIEYSISSADTWEKKTITITPTAGSTSLITGAGGIIANDNGHGFRLKFGLHYGTDFHGTNNTWVASGTVFGTSNQVNWVDSTSNNFYLTGIQLELGSNATPFEHRSYGDELKMCKRYYQQSWVGNTPNVNSDYVSVTPPGSLTGSVFICDLPYQEEPRAAPTVTLYSPSNGAAGEIRCDANDTSYTFSVSAAWLKHARLSGTSLNAGRSKYHYKLVAEL